MNLVKDIVEGHFNEMFDINKDLYELRNKICLSCPLYKKGIRPKCNNKLWLNPLTGDVNTELKQGYVRGCGCFIGSKTRLERAHCPALKW